LKAALEKKLPQVKVELRKGSNGIFDVSLKGKLLYSKRKTGRFPEETEILGMLSDTAQ